MTAGIGPAWRVDRWITGGSRPHKPAVETDDDVDDEPEDD